MTDLMTFNRPSSGGPLFDIVSGLIYGKWRNHPRSQQVELGPSEIGEPCTRRLAYNIMHHKEVNEGDPLPSMVGIAAHAWMEDACVQANERAGKQVWIPESVVRVDDRLSGHSDAYHVDTRTVFDWKFPSPSRMTEVRKNGASQQYRIQAHCYGKGFKRRGLQVDRVAIAFLPRGGFLKDAFIWSEPFDEKVADDGLRRYYEVTELCVAIGVDQNHGLYKLFPKHAGHHCTYCEWFRPTETDTGATCPGFTNEG